MGTRAIRISLPTAAASPALSGRRAWSDRRRLEAAVRREGAPNARPSAAGPSNPGPPETASSSARGFGQRRQEDVDRRVWLPAGTSARA